jgi:hypothetical protein
MIYDFKSIKPWSFNSIKVKGNTCDFKNNQNNGNGISTLIFDFD